MVKISEKKIFKKNAVNLGVLQILNYVLPLITIPYLLRVIGVEKYGLLIFVMTALSYVAVVTDYGFNLSATREIALRKDSKQDLREIVNSVHIIKLATLTIFTLIIFIVFGRSSNFTQNKLTYAYTYLFIISQIFMPVWFYQGVENFTTLTRVNIASKIIAAALIFMLVKDSQDYNLVPIINSLCGIMATVILLFYAYKKFEINIEFPKINEIIWQLKNGWDIFLSSIFINLYANSMTFMLGLSGGSMNVGYFATADKIIQAIKALYQPIAQAMYPMISRVFSENREKGFEFVKEIRKIALIINFAAMMLLLIFADNMIYILAGKYISEAALVLRIMSPIPMLVSVSNIYGIQIMLNIGLRKKFRLILMCGALAGVVLGYLMIEKYSVYGASIVVGLIEAGIAGVMYLSVKKVITIKER
jgi:polysaccharide transporter, PST family